MAATIKELFESRRGGVGPDGNMTLMYVVQGTADLDAVKTLVDATAPATFDEKNIGPSYDVEESGPELWIIRVPYVPPSVNARTSASDTQDTFDISAETVNVRVSKDTLSRTPATITDYKQLVNVEVRNGRIAVQGADVLVPKFEFTKEKIYTNAYLSDSKKKEWADMVGTTNTLAFGQYPIGSVLYLGCSGRRRNRGDWTVSHRFAYSPNRTDVVIGDITVPSVPGWAYLWVSYEEVEDTVNFKLAVQPSGVYVERMFEATNFTALAT